MIKQGASTLTISLPASWANKNNLKNGDELNCEELDDELLLQKQTIKKTRTINFSENSHTFIRTSIIAAYCNNYNTIICYFSNEKIYLEINQIINNYLIGFDIVKKEKNHCIIQNITEPEIKQFDTIFKKVLFGVSLFIEETESRCKEKTDFKSHKQTIANIHQYENFCKRLITKRNPFGKKAPQFWEFLNHLVQSARELHHLNNYLDNNENKNIKEEKQYLQTVSQYMNLLQKAYIEKNQTRILALHKLHAQKMKDSITNHSILNNQKNQATYHIIVTLRHLYLASNALLGLLTE